MICPKAPNSRIPPNVLAPSQSFTTTTLRLPTMLTRESAPPDPNCCENLRRVTSAGPALTDA